LSRIPVDQRPTAASSCTRPDLAPHFSEGRHGRSRAVPKPPDLTRGADTAFLPGDGHSCPGEISIRIYGSSTETIAEAVDQRPSRLRHSRLRDLTRRT
jgi:hypothetical protein